MLTSPSTCYLTLLLSSCLGLCPSPSTVSLSRVVMILLSISPEIGLLFFPLPSQSLQFIFFLAADVVIREKILKLAVYKLQTGDVVDEFQIGSCPAVRSPFKGGKSGVNKILHAAFKRGNTSIRVRVRRGADSQTIELNACVVPDEKMAGRKQYVLRSIRDPNYSVGFVEKMESECLVLQDSRSTRVVSALSKAQIQDGYIAYPWEMKMKEALPIPNSSSFLSMLVLPRVSDPVAYRYNSLEDTLAKANSWLNSSQVSGVPIQFMNVQTEGLLTKIGKDVGRCLEIAMAKKGLDMQVAALVNDTVGTLALGHYHDEDTVAAVIFGTGTNACYVEQTDAIIKCQGQYTNSDRMVIIWNGEIFGQHICHELHMMLH